MGMSNAERQARYRARALKEPGGLLLTRLQVMLSSSADGQLRRLAKETGLTKRECVEMAIEMLARDRNCLF